MYAIKKAILRLDLNEFNFDFDSGYIDGSDQWLEPNEIIELGYYSTVHEASDEVDRTVYVSIDLNLEDLIIEYEYISGDDGFCISHFEDAEFNGTLYEIDNDLYCPELAQILKDRIYEIKEQE
jgi:hypothetical protein